MLGGEGTGSSIQLQSASRARMFERVVRQRPLVDFVPQVLQFRRRNTPDQNVVHGDPGLALEVRYVYGPDVFLLLLRGPVENQVLWLIVGSEPYGIDSQARNVVEQNNAVVVQLQTISELEKWLVAQIDIPAVGSQRCLVEDDQAGRCSGSQFLRDSSRL